ncbi:MAG: sulfotransferase family protein [Euryarchaeota archaeon]|nr:sulfotransferase family protein [Euryarchaeota archaeon]
MSDEVKIAMWSGPRNISTAMMYAFDNRLDCHATDEPLYANFLMSTGTQHPGAHEVMREYETDLEQVISQLTGPIPRGKTIWYQKHMCHHVMDDSDISWIDGLTNCFLIRDPREVLLSLSKITDSIDLRSTGLPQQIRIMEHVTKESGFIPPILDSKEILENPRALLGELCDSVGINFDHKMLSWEPGPRDCDGVWAEHWYSSVWSSSGFAPPSIREGELSPHLSGVLEEAMPLYQKLREIRVRP